MANVQVAVVADVPLLRIGIETILADAGYEIETPAEALEWARRRSARGERSLLLQTTRPGAMARIEGVSQLRFVTVLALVHAENATIYLAAIVAGASGVVPWTAERATIVRAAEAALAGFTILPTGMLRMLATGPTESHSLTLSDGDAVCLRDLASGAPVRQLAEALHCSEREFYRRLRKLYVRLGVETRQAAVEYAHEAGLI